MLFTFNHVNSNSSQEKHKLYVWNISKKSGPETLESWLRAVRQRIHIADYSRYSYTSHDVQIELYDVVMDKLEEEARAVLPTHPRHAEITAVITQAAADYHYAAEEAKAYILGKARRKFRELHLQS